jgi:hypothetical protein
MEEQEGFDGIEEIDDLQGVLKQSVPDFINILENGLQIGISRVRPMHDL